jgi:hypothetical protein
MNRVVESLKRTNRQELTQPCPNREMVVEGQKVTLSQVKRYIRRNNIPIASQDDASHDFLCRTADDHSDHPFTNSISAYSSDQSSLSIYALIEYLSLCLTPEEIIDLSDQLRRFSNTDLHALATGFHRRRMFVIPLSLKASLTYDSHISFTFTTVLLPIHLSPQLHAVKHVCSLPRRSIRSEAAISS